MPEFGKTSSARLATCHPDLQRVMREVVKHFDISIVCGYRGQAAQQLAFDASKSNATFGESPHNYKPALAVDIVPWPNQYKDPEEMIYLAGQVIATARSMGVELKWGGDWDRDTHLSDNRFDDFPHFELVGWREMVADMEA